MNTARITDNANDTLHSAGQTLQGLGHRASEMAHQASDSAQHLAHDGAQALRDGVAKTQASTRRHVQEHPVGSLLTAIGVGAALVLLASVVLRNRTH